MMTRHQIIAAAEQIIKAIENAGIFALMEDARENRTLQDYLKAFKEYNILAEQFSEGALFLEEELGFSSLRDPDPWIVMSNHDDPGSDNPLSHIRGIVNTLASISNMLNRSRLAPEDFQGKEVLSLILFEDEQEASSTPSRISDSLESIELLYEACARMQGTPFDDLRVISCDSGSDMLFDFLGSASVIEAVKELILSIWERVIFYRNRNLQERISLLTHSLPILDKITELELDGALTAEEGEQTRNAIVFGVTRFLSSGSMIMEIRERTTFDERSLMAPQAAMRTETGLLKDFAQPVKETPHPPVPTTRKFMALETFETLHQTTAEVAEPEEDMAWDGVLEDDLKTLRELIDRTKRSEEEPG